MKARTFILTTGAAFALAVPAAHAAGSTNRLHQTLVHTVLADKAHQAIGKTLVSKKQTCKSQAGKCRRGGLLVQTGPFFLPAPPAAATSDPVIEDGALFCVDPGSELVEDGTAQNEQPSRDASQPSSSADGSVGSHDAPASVMTPAADSAPEPVSEPAYWQDIP